MTCDHRPLSCGAHPTVHSAVDTDSFVSRSIISMLILFGLIGSLHSATLFLSLKTVFDSVVQCSAPMVEPPVPAHSRNKTPSGGSGGGSSRFPLIDQNRGSSRADKLSLIERSPSRATPMPHPDQISDADMAMAWMRMHTHAMQLLLKCMADHHDHEYIQTYAIGAQPHMAPLPSYVHHWYMILISDSSCKTHSLILELSFSFIIACLG